MDSLTYTEKRELRRLREEEAAYDAWVLTTSRRDKWQPKPAADRIEGWYNGRVGLL